MKVATLFSFFANIYCSIISTSTFLSLIIFSYFRAWGNFETFVPFSNTQTLCNDINVGNTCLPVLATLVCQCWQHLFASVGNTCLPVLATLVCQCWQHLFASVGNTCLPVLATLVCQCWQHLFASVGNTCLPVLATLVCQCWQHLFVNVGNTCLSMLATLVCQCWQHLFANVILCFPCLVQLLFIDNVYKSFIAVTD